MTCSRIKESLVTLVQELEGQKRFYKAAAALDRVLEEVWENLEVEEREEAIELYSLVLGEKVSYTY